MTTQNLLSRTFCWLLLCFCLIGNAAAADNARKIDRKARAALERLYAVAPQTRAVLARAHGVLVFPAIYKAGIGIGGELGKGALYRGGVRSGFYRLASGSIGLQLGAQKRVQVIAFMTSESLQKFVNSEGFKVGVDGSVVIADLGASGKVDSTTFNKPIIGFVLGERGLMYNISLEGARIWRFVP